MTIRARDSHMTALQFERGTIVIKGGRMPSFHDMTRGTVYAQFAPMRIILPVAGEAVLLSCLQVEDRVRIHMACGACKAGVLPVQSKTKPVMVELMTVGVCTVVTIKAGRAERGLMVGHEDGIRLDMAFLTRGDRKRGDIIRMTIAAQERFVLRLE